MPCSGTSLWAYCLPRRMHVIVSVISEIPYNVTAE
jgi:hypothetical protein